MKFGRWLFLSIGAAAIAGTLDFVAAALIARANDSGAVRMLQYIASGVFGTQAGFALKYALIGLILHYAIVACMAGAYMLAASRVPLARSRPLLAGAGYGLLLWAVMTLLVVPLRWPGQPLVTGALALAGQLFCHIVLVGMPIALVYAWGKAAPVAAAPARRRHGGRTPARAPRR